MDETGCNLQAQGFARGSCNVSVNGHDLPACRATLKSKDGAYRRLILDVHLSRPENYLSIYQVGCNISCKKCHSWQFSRKACGDWTTPAELASKAAAYETQVTVCEPRDRATAWHAHDTCSCCGSCVAHNRRSKTCPGLLPPESIVFSPQGFGPARNIVAFTGGDLSCTPEFYAETTGFIKSLTNLWVLMETNGYGLTPKNLDILGQAGVDSLRLDIKAFDPQTHKWLTGCDNQNILKLPGEILKRGFVLEVSALYIPGVVEADDLENTARLVKQADPDIPFTLTAFFPEYKMARYRRPTAAEMAEAYQRVKSAGLSNVRLGNTEAFALTPKDRRYLAEHVDKDAF